MSDNFVRDLMNINKWRTLRAQRVESQEDGFTLLELVVVVIVIGILAGISIPVFAGQQRASIEGTLKADLRQAALVMHTESVRNSGRYSSYLPNYQTQSASNIVFLDKTRSSSYAFCLTGTNPEIPATTLYYNSTSGKISTTACAVINATTGGTSFSVSQPSALATKKAAIVASVNITTAQLGTSKIELQNLGYGTVDLLNETTFIAASPSAYDFIYLKYSAWAPPTAVSSAAYAAYQTNGSKVFVDGNDAASGSMPDFIKTNVTLTSGSSFVPTYKQGLVPSFPYTFSGVAFGSDGWSCITSLQQGVPIATKPGGGPSGEDCITMFGANNAKNGRYVFMISSENTPTKDAAWSWLTS